MPFRWYPLPVPLDVENVLPSKPFLIQMIVHLAADPGWGEYFCMRPRPLLLLLLRFENARLNAVAPHIPKRILSHLRAVGIVFTQ